MNHIKKHTTLLALSLSVALITLSQASAAIIAQDDFTYADGSLASNGSAADTGWAGAWTDVNGTDFSVTNGEVTQTANFGRIQRSLSADQGTDGTTVYIGIDNAIGNVFSGIEFHFDGSTDSERPFYLGRNGAGGGLYLGSTLTATSSSFDSARYVIQVNFGVGAANDTGELFRNNISQGTFSTASDLSFNRVSFGGFVGASRLLATDNLIIASTFAEAIPEPSTYAMLAGLSGLVFVMVRRCR